MNNEQITSIIRQVMLVVAGMISGVTFISKFFTPDQVVSLLTSDTVIGVLVSLVTGSIASAWAIITRSNKNLVVAADKVPGVAGVITQPTVQGRELASSIPSPTVVSARTVDAEAVAKAA